MTCGAPTTCVTSTFERHRRRTSTSPSCSGIARPAVTATKGHIMTGVDTIGYNIAWFSPKPMFIERLQVCWDINETHMSRRKWTQVLVRRATPTRRDIRRGHRPRRRQSARSRAPADSTSATRHPTSVATDGPNDGLFPQGGTLAGFKDLDGLRELVPEPGHNGTTTGSSARTAPDREQTTDKAARFKHCLTNMPNNTVRLTKDTPPTGTRHRHLPGQIPQGPCGSCSRTTTTTRPRTSATTADCR